MALKIYVGGSRAATSKMECFVLIVNGWKPLAIITKHSILDVAAALDPFLIRGNVIFSFSLIASEKIDENFQAQSKTLNINSLGKI